MEKSWATANTHSRTVSVVFKDQIWVVERHLPEFTGTFSGRHKQRVVHSLDGKIWKRVSTVHEVLKNVDKLVVWNNKLWLTGNPVIVEREPFPMAPSLLLEKVQVQRVHSSHDGFTWQHESNLPVGDTDAVFPFGSKLVVVGSVPGELETKTFSSFDGEVWQEEKEAILGRTGRILPTVMIHRNSAWMITELFVFQYKPVGTQ